MRRYRRWMWRTMSGKMWENTVIKLPSSVAWLEGRKCKFWSLFCKIKMAGLTLMELPGEWRWSLVQLLPGLAARGGMWWGWWTKITFDGFVTKIPLTALFRCCQTSQSSQLPSWVLLGRASPSPLPIQPTGMYCLTRSVFVDTNNLWRPQDI